MISANKISLSFGGVSLFEDLSFMINPGDRVALIGKNGAGKSTLLKILAGELKTEKGEVSIKGEGTIGYLPQELPLPEGKTVMEETESAFEEIKLLEKKIEDYNTQLTTRTDYESDEYMQIITDLGEATSRFELIGGYNFHGQIEQVLKGLGFKEEDLDMPTESFSGGWRMRIELAKLLLQAPDILLLDEPTNHLDIESIMWIEGFLKNYQGSVILVSHDKTFLNNVTNRTIEIVLGTLYDQKLPYDKFLVWRDEVKEKQMQAFKNQEKEIKQTEELISKFRAKASKAAFAQSLIKKLDKMDRIEVDVTDNKTMKFKFPECVQPGKVVFEIDNLSKSYDDKQVIKNLNLRIHRGEKIAFVGQNGQGKTTLARLVLGELEHEGKIIEGHQVKIGYYAQEQHLTLDPEETVLDTIATSASDALRPKARDMLGSFLFSGDDVFKKVKVLSGGERGRLALCKLLLEPCNVLVMDEPTNHLDIQSKEVLKEALRRFDGTLLVVSHDRDFLQGMTNKVLEFKEGQINEHIGDVKEFLQARKVEDMRLLEKRSKEEKTTKKEVSSQQQDHQAKKEQEKLEKKLTNRISRIEEEIAAIDQKLAKEDAKLQDPEQFKKLSEDQAFYAAYEKLQEKKKSLEAEWEQKVEELETVSAKG